MYFAVMRLLFILSDGNLKESSIRVPTQSLIMDPGQREGGSSYTWPGNDQITDSDFQRLTQIHSTELQIFSDMHQ